MFRLVLAAVMLAGPSAVAAAQSASAALAVTATVVSSCKVDVPAAVERSRLPTVPVAVTCARGGGGARVQRPPVPRRTEIRDAVLTIDF